MVCSELSVAAMCFANQHSCTCQQQRLLAIVAAGSGIAVASLHRLLLAATFVERHCRSYFDPSLTYRSSNAAAAVHPMAAVSDILKCG